MRARSETERAFRKEFAVRLGEAILKKRISLREVARILMVSRQSVHKYLKQKATPRADVVQRALSEWGLVLHVGEMRLTATSYKRSTLLKPRVEPLQMTLPDVIRSLENRNLDVRILGRKMDSVQIEVNIRFAS
jgi:transcriptional regulator with XRE-family HTH domain